MYRPPYTRAEDDALVRALVDAHPFALLLTMHEGAPELSHLPLLRVGDVLTGHLARANPHARRLDGRAATAVFQGPSAYVSPSWYGAPDEHVPTWNYAVVHAHGVLRVLPDATDAVMEATARFDPTFELNRALVAQLVPAIVAFELVVERWEGKLKLSQNRDEEDRLRVQAQLAAGDEGQRSVAALMGGGASADLGPPTGP